MNKQPIRQLAVYLFLLALTFAATNVLYYRLREVKVIFYQAEAHYKKQEFSDAIPLYVRAMVNGENRRSLYVRLGEAYTNQKEFSEAIQIYRNYLDVHPNDREMRLKLARTLSWQGNLSEAEKEYNKLIVLNGEDGTHDKNDESL